METSSGSRRFSGNSPWAAALLWNLFFLFLSVNAVWGQADSTNPASDLSTPYKTLSTVLLNLREENFHPETASRAFQQKGISRKQAIDFAEKFYQVLAGKGIILNLEDVPQESDYLDSASYRHQYVPVIQFPDIYLEKSGASWVFSKPSLSRIVELHHQIYPLGARWIEDLLPHFGGFRILGLYAWQFEAILIVLIAGFFIHRLLTFLFEKLFTLILNRMGQRGLMVGHLKPIARPLSSLAILLAFMTLVPSIQLQVLVTKYILLILKALWPILVTIIFYRLMDVLSAYMSRLAARKTNTLDDQLVPLVRKALKVLVIISGVLIILLNFNISILPFITGLSIGGLALALAAQDTIKNLFGSLMIFIDKPFQIGHWIVSGDIDGEVEEVGFRSTRIRTSRDSVIYVPNGKLADSIIDNNGLRTWRRFTTTLTLTYDTPPGVIRTFIDGLERIVQEHPGTRKDKYYIYLNDLGDSSLNVLFYVFFDARTWAGELQSRQEILFRILGLAETLNVRLSYPTQTLHIESFPEKTSLTPGPAFNPDELKRKLEEFFKAK